MYTLQDNQEYKDSKSFAEVVIAFKVRNFCEKSSNLGTRGPHSGPWDYIAARHHNSGKGSLISPGTTMAPWNPNGVWRQQWGLGPQWGNTTNRGPGDHKGARGPQWGPCTRDLNWIWGHNGARGSSWIQSSLEVKMGSLFQGDRGTTKVPRDHKRSLGTTKELRTIMGAGVYNGSW